MGRKVAAALGWTFFDSGLLYRALTWLAQRRGVTLDDVAGLVALARNLDVRVQPPSVPDGRDADVLLDGVDVTWELRSPAVDRAVSVVSAVPAVREALVAPQRRAVGEMPAVVAGRDIGTVIFPDAMLKVYLEASLEERARRRARELAARGVAVDLDAVRQDLARRDALDSARACAPLQAAPDAVWLDTERRGPDEVAAQIVALWRARSGGQC